MRIRYTRKALVQLDDICSFTAARDAPAARRVIERIKHSIQRLGNHPYSARPTKHPGIRVLTVGRYPYLVFYRVDDATEEVQVLRIRHSAQDPAYHLD